MRVSGQVRGWASALLLAVAACGYSFAASGRLAGGVERASVQPFESGSAEPELAVAFASALRQELASRGTLGSGGGAVVDGAVSAAPPAPAAPGGVSWRIVVEVKARLRQGDRIVTERTLRREADYPAGVDALETEGRKAQALRRLVADCARELAASLME